MEGQRSGEQRGRRDLLPWRTGPVPVEPLVEADLGIGTQDAVVLEFQDPLHAREELVIEPHIRQGAVHHLLGRYVPRLGQDHQVQLAHDLLVLYRGAPAQEGDTLVGADEEEAPVWGDDGDHVQQLGHEVGHDPRLDDQGDLGGIVGGPRVVGRRPVDLYGWYPLPCLL